MLYRLGQADIALAMPAAPILQPCQTQHGGAYQQERQLQLCQQDLHVGQHSGGPVQPATASISDQLSPGHAADAHYPKVPRPASPVGQQPAPEQVSNIWTCHPFAKLPYSCASCCLDQASQTMHRLGLCQTRLDMPYYGVGGLGFSSILYIQLCASDACELHSCVWLLACVIVQKVCVTFLFKLKTCQTSSKPRVIWLLCLNYPI